MTEFLLTLLFAECVALIGWGMVRRPRMIQYPFLIAVTFLGWVLPQLIGLNANSSLPPGALNKTVGMAVLCVGASYLGYALNARSAKLYEWRFDRGRLLKVSVLYSIFGAGFYYQVSQHAAEAIVAHGGAWTGVITILVFLSRLLTIGLVLAVILHLNRPTWATAVIIAFTCALYLERILVRGRRAVMVELGLIVLMALWFHRRWLPSRSLVFGAMILGVLVVNSIGDYRHAMFDTSRFGWSGAGIEQIAEIDFLGNIRRLANGDGAFELTNAAMNIEAVDRSLDLDFGLSLWNAVVHAFVPGQLVSYEWKRGLMLDLENSAGGVLGHTPHFGSTETGLSDAFQSFWFFGAIKFLVIGIIMSRWWRAAVSGSWTAQMVVMLSAAASLQAVTHSTHHFFIALLEILILLVPALMLARVRRG